MRWQLKEPHVIDPLMFVFNLLACIFIEFVIILFMIIIINEICILISGSTYSIIDSIAISRLTFSSILLSYIFVTLIENMLTTRVTCVMYEHPKPRN